MTENNGNPILVERMRAGYRERAHSGRFAIVDRSGTVVMAMGNIEEPFLPRSSCKILQAMPMMESGAGAHLSQQRLALSCASHQGSAFHAETAEAWLAEMGLSEADLECGAQPPSDAETRHALRDAGRAPCQLHNNCSGKHTAMLRQAVHIGAPTAGYSGIDHPVQRAIAQATAEMAGEDLHGHAIDGCSAPNFAISLTGLARAMAKIASAETSLEGARRDGAIRLRDAMAAHPFEVAGEGRACTDLMRAGGGDVVVKTGAEGAFTAILPGLGLGIAVKIDDGNTEAATVATTAALVALGALDASDPRVSRWLTPKEINRRGTVCGGSEAVAALRSLTIN
ncbi:MAG: asparaginase [Pikeienuella sp.]